MLGCNRTTWDALKLYIWAGLDPETFSGSTVVQLATARVPLAAFAASPRLNNPIMADDILPGRVKGTGAKIYACEDRQGTDLQRCWRSGGSLQRGASQALLESSASAAHAIQLHALACTVDRGRLKSPQFEKRRTHLKCVSLPMDGLEEHSCHSSGCPVPFCFCKLAKRLSQHQQRPRFKLARQCQLALRTCMTNAAGPWRWHEACVDFASVQSIACRCGFAQLLLVAGPASCQTAGSTSKLQCQHVAASQRPACRHARHGRHHSCHAHVGGSQGSVRRDHHRCERPTSLCR